MSQAADIAKLLESSSDPARDLAHALRMYASKELGVSIEEVYRADVQGMLNKTSAIAYEITSPVVPRLRKNLISVVQPLASKTFEDFDQCEHALRSHFINEHSKYFASHYVFSDFLADITSCGFLAYDDEAGLYSFKLPAPELSHDLAAAPTASRADDEGPSR